jgi:hypothetical protein
VPQNQVIALQILAILAMKPALRRAEVAILAIHTSYEIPNIFG